jgi:hypothetical protein
VIVLPRQARDKHRESTQKSAPFSRSRFFHEELKTSDWIRATSPACNCNNSHRVPPSPAAVAGAGTKAEEERREGGQVQEQEQERERGSRSGVGGSAGSDGPAWPGLLTCAADREDHGTTGANSRLPFPYACCPEPVMANHCRPKQD